ncbi:MAG TPA: SpoIIE family protein phosphatase, partial [Allocoleopsis sp.]
YPLLWSQKKLAEAKTTSQQEIQLQPDFLKARGIPLGILPIWKGNTGNVTLNSGDVFLLTSDGITEATIMKPITDDFKSGFDIPVGSMLKQEGLWQFLINESIPLDLTNLLNHLRQYSEDQEDDQTIVSLEVL